LTLAELADRSELSASHLSQIEQDKKMPSLVALTHIAEVLDINPRYLLEPEENQVFITRADLKPENIAPLPPIMSVALTSVDSGSDFEVHRLVLQPQTHGVKFEPHAGEVLGFVLEGKLSIVIEDQPVELEAGDSIHYDANQYYGLSCSGEEPCVVIWCSSPPWTDFDAKIQTVLGVEANIPAETQ
jgi:mannose-6-phosphate isomerase-like protein (cupin superfamily)